jgi:hypothetical protein
MYYLVTVGYETDRLDRNGRPRLDKIKYVIQAESVEEVGIISAKYRKDDMRASETLSIVKLNVDCVIDLCNKPDLYK